MRKITFFAPGTPKGQPRVRACIRGRHAGVYDPGTADEWKQAVRVAALKALNGVPFSGPLSLRLDFGMPRPKGHFTKKGLRTTAPLYHTIKPDLDNCTKAVKDALTNVGVWHDDSQVCVSIGTKSYSSLTGCQITIKEITA